MERRRRGSAPPSDVLEPVRNLINLGWQLGSFVFLAVSVYLLWGLLSGSLIRAYGLPAEDRLRIVNNILIASKALTISGGVVLVCAAVRFFYEETVGYIFLIAGAALYWGISYLIGNPFQNMPRPMVPVALYMLGQFKMVGVFALAGAVPFIMGDVWLKAAGVRGISRREKKTSTTTAPEEEQPSSGKLYINCWQMPYCRPYIRKLCKAYEERRACWRMKSGCYCDEDLVLRAVKQQSKDGTAFNARFSQTAGKRKDPTPAEKRQRCRNCFLYSEHQKQKYRFISPLAFPAAIAIMWAFSGSIKAFLHRAIEFSEHFAEIVSFSPKAGEVAQNPWTNLPATGDTVQWLMMFCLGLILVTYLLRFIEYCVFKWQI